MAKLIHRTDDLLWKSILEHTFIHFLRFFFVGADEIFNLTKRFDYLDKEFESLFPPEPNGKGVRFVDKLVKVYLKDGREKFVLCHIEVQSRKGKGDLAERMFRYFYKIFDKYQVPITAIAILADDNCNYRPSLYVQEFMGTQMSYTFNCYKILDQDESELRANQNPFAVVVLTALLAILNKKLSDDQLKDIKHDLYNEMINRDMDRKTRKGIYDFLMYYVRFEDQVNLTIFEQELKTKSGRNIVMGTNEYLLDKAKKEGKIEGRIEGKREEAIAIALEFKKMGLPLEDIAKGTGLTVEEIEKLK